MLLDVTDAEKPSSRPHAVSIVVANEDHSFKLDEDALHKVLMRDEIKDRYVVVISVAGAFRHGKSFLLDFFLRYLNSKVITLFFIVLLLLFSKPCQFLDSTKSKNVVCHFINNQFKNETTVTNYYYFIGIFLRLYQNFN